MNSPISASPISGNLSALSDNSANEYGSGGVLVDGSSTSSCILFAVSGGGVVVSGIDDNETIYCCEAGSGGAVLDSAARVAAIYKTEASGGAVLDSAARFNELLATAVAGGVLLAGTATAVRAFTIDASGGVVVSGIDDNETIYCCEAGRGGAVIGGTTNNILFAHAIAQGGLVAGGASRVAAIFLADIGCTEDPDTFGDGPYAGGPYVCPAVVMAGTALVESFYQGGAVLGGTAEETFAVHNYFGGFMTWEKTSSKRYYGLGEAFDFSENEFVLTIRGKTQIQATNLANQVRMRLDGLVGQIDSSYAAACSLEDESQAYSRQDEGSDDAYYVVRQTYKMLIQGE